MLLIVAGAVVLSWPGEADFGSVLPALAVLGACLAWGVDNNLTRKVSLADATFIAMAKGLVAGATNTGLALLAGAAVPKLSIAAAAGAVGFFGYSISLVLFVLALRRLGAARTGAYFATAPFAGALVAIAILGEPLTLPLAIASALMACGVWLHVTERHEHAHGHEMLEHAHEHEHDEHHQHVHAEPVMPGARHDHMHRHERLTHSHPHYPDTHHRHDH
jgi:drug/metabolite transporter (DMT)-like permease